MIGEMSIKELAITLSVAESVIRDWTSSQRRALEEERNRKIIELYLRAENTQQSIADVLGIDRTTVTKIIENVKNGESDAFHKDFSPYLYNIWALGKQNVATEAHFGAFPEVYMENLLYYHTELLDIVYDPFAGAGTTVDVCKRMFRRYYCSDLNVVPGREKNISTPNFNSYNIMYIMLYCLSQIIIELTKF